MLLYATRKIIVSVLSTLVIVLGYYLGNLVNDMASFMMFFLIFFCLFSTYGTIISLLSEKIAKVNLITSLGIYLLGGILFPLFFDIIEIAPNFHLLLNIDGYYKFLLLGLISSFVYWLIDKSCSIYN
ncbi:hypothetical protein [Salinithrix halophila]|uniref:ABC-2 type transport system permease protein n=1 Tax=Salinithrix halophila TaxID=1485204 RepID=A0ABV8JG26_9BACL